MENSTEDERRAQSQQESVEEAVFMSQFLPRSLNQLADYYVGKIEEGDVEDTYANVVASLTGNEEVVTAASKGTAEDGTLTSLQVLLAANKLRQVVEGDDFDPDDLDASKFSDEEKSGSVKVAIDTYHTGEEKRYVKIVMTPEKAAAAKEASRAARKANKKAAKEAQSEKRKTKIKKKDKQRAINKTKGNKKKK